jgi:hypothetical protein
MNYICEVRKAFYLFPFLFYFVSVPGNSRACDANRCVFALVSPEDIASTHFEWSTGVILEKSNHHLYFSFNKKKKPGGVENIRFLVPVDLSLLHVIYSSSRFTPAGLSFQRLSPIICLYRGPPTR